MSDVECALLRFTVAQSPNRKLNPEIPLLGVGGRPIEDEVEFELLLN